MTEIKHEPYAYRVRHKGDERWALSTYDPRLNLNGTVNAEIEAEPLYLGTPTVVAAEDTLLALKDLLAMVREHPALQGREYVGLGIRVTNAIAKGGH